MDSVGLPSFLTKNASPVFSTKNGPPIRIILEYSSTDSNISSPAPSQPVMVRLKNKPASNNNTPIAKSSSIEILNALLASSLSPFPASILMEIHPPTASRAEKTLIIKKIGIAKVTTDKEASSRYCPIIIASAMEAIAVVKFIKIVGTNIVIKIFFTIGLCLYLYLLSMSSPLFLKSNHDIIHFQSSLILHVVCHTAD